MQLRGANLYELTHDRLVDPILRSNQRWKSKSDLPLQAAAENWSRSNRDERFLLHGVKLRTATEWAAANPGLVWDLERDFLLESERNAGKRSYRRAAIVVSIAFNILVGLGLVGFYVSAKSREARKALVSHVRELDAIVKLSEETDPSRSTVLALASAAVSLKYPDEKETLRESQDALSLAVRAPQSLILQNLDGDLTGVTYDPTGRYFATSSSTGTVEIRDAITGRPT